MGGSKTFWTFRTSDPNFLKKSAFFVLTSEKYGVIYPAGKNNKKKYKRYVCYIRTDNSDTNWYNWYNVSAKNVKFVFRKKNPLRNIPHIQPKSRKRRRINDFPIFAHTTYPQGDATYPQARCNISTGQIQPNRSFLPKITPILTDFCPFFAWYNSWYISIQNSDSTDRIKRRTAFCVHLIERYLILGFLTDVEEYFASRLTYLRIPPKWRKYVKTP